MRKAFLTLLGGLLLAGCGYRAPMHQSYLPVVTDSTLYAGIRPDYQQLAALMEKDTGMKPVEGKAPTAIYLARKGKAIYARSGKDVLPDYDEAAVDLELPEECYVGLFLCSHEEDVVETGHFRNVVFKQ